MKECIQHILFDLKGPNCEKVDFFVLFSIVGQVERNPSASVFDKLEKRVKKQLSYKVLHILSLSE